MLAGVFCSLSLDLVNLCLNLCYVRSAVCMLWIRKFSKTSKMHSHSGPVCLESWELASADLTQSNASCIQKAARVTVATFMAWACVWIDCQTSIGEQTPFTSFLRRPPIAKEGKDKHGPKCSDCWCCWIMPG